jgi:hypothetical protein
VPDLARIAYEAYGESTGGLNYQGLPMPAWEDLPEAIRQAWDAASQAVLQSAIKVQPIGWQGAAQHTYTAACDGNHAPGPCPPDRLIQLPASS